MRYSSFVFIFSVIFFSILFIAIKPCNTAGILHGEHIFTLNLVTLLIFLFQYYFRKRFGEVFGEIDRYIFLLIPFFLDFKEVDDDKKSLADKEEIKREQERKKFNQQFSYFLLPYEAYRIMGVLPSVTKNQLKKVYRDSAKKHHPDKFAVKIIESFKKQKKNFRRLRRRMM